MRTPPTPAPSTTPRTNREPPPPRRAARRLPLLRHRHHGAGHRRTAPPRKCGKRSRPAAISGIKSTICSCVPSTRRRLTSITSVGHPITVNCMHAGAAKRRPSTTFWGLGTMAPTIRKYSRTPVTVDAAEYDGSPKNRQVILNWIARRGGVAVPASEIMWRPDMGCYYHQQLGFIYLPQGARSAGSTLTALRDDELVVRTDTGVYALVFPGDYVVRSRSGFYPLASESFARSYVSYNSNRRGLPHRVSPAS